MEEGGVGIVFHTSRGGRVLVVKSLVAGGAAERSCAVEVGHQIIAVGDQDVTSATLEEVAGLLRGPANSTVQLRFLETRDVRLVVERTFTDKMGEATVGVKWKNTVGEFIVEGVLEEYSGFGGSPKGGDRLLRIDGESIDDMRDDEIRRKLAGEADSSVRLDFARGVAQHSVTLTRQPLGLAAVIGRSTKNISEAVSGSTSLRSSVDPTAETGSSSLSESSTALAPFQRPGKSANSPGKSDPPTPDSERHSGLKLEVNQQSHSQKPEPLNGGGGEWKQEGESAQLRSVASPKEQQDSVNQQLVDIVRRLKQELATQAKEVVDLKAAHKAEIAQYQSNGPAPDSNEVAQIKSMLQSAQQRLREAEDDIKHKEQELSGVKSVLTRRAEAIGDSKKKLDEAELALAQTRAEKEGLERANIELRSTRELDEKNLRAAADAALRWQIVEMEKSANAAKAELQAKTEELNRANETIKIQAESTASGQKAHEGTQAKLTSALEELNRLRKSNEEFANIAKSTKAKSEEVSKELEERNNKLAGVEKELEEAKQELVTTEDQYTLTLQQHEEGWEKRCAEAEEEWKKKHTAATTQIASMQDQLDVGTKERDELQVAVKELEEMKAKLQDTNEELQGKIHQQAKELAEVSARADQATSRSEKLTDATHSWRDQLAAAQKTIEAHKLACLQESNRREDLEERLQQQQKQIEEMQVKLREFSELRQQHDMAQERLKGFDQLQQQLQNDARQRMQYMRQISGNVPYQQLLGMLQESNQSVTSLQGVVQAKDTQLGAIQQRLNELSNVREMTVDAERQLMKLKEALDWKTITLHQMSATLATCQTEMQNHGMPEELIEQVADALALHAQSARRDEEVGSSFSQAPTAPAQSTAPNGKPSLPQAEVSSASVYGDVPPTVGPYPMNVSLHGSMGPPNSQGMGAPSNQVPLHSSFGAPNNRPMRMPPGGYPAQQTEYAMSM
mmetsp:Transcript_37959/g.77891  ORF Transcript_37959/g.77891 Transcript_37959/m.77891 type:complete len:964 (-) Transcript_37959:282-3173(-)|eukprot:CAMPEP_0181324246 /NCGR_PEP_ID=MMETSP1101-20121128/20249_1 /TAXON_ID=46948 /ORGANISM="Rhodomonas abbreviata, Strain Caron Lab Isolate" /LENGTH=963 /DNA_ID=CAMNT_0023432393 /DNA_START=246 /DNA_END=3137 /DNA_ORIENTATION=+